MALPFLKSIAVFAIVGQLLCGNVVLGSTLQQENVAAHSNISSEGFVSQIANLHSANSHHDKNTCQPDEKCLRSLSGVSVPQIQDEKSGSNTFFSPALDSVTKAFFLQVVYSPYIVPRTPLVPYGNLYHQLLVVMRL